jgi:hypothetical protein
MPGKEVKLPLAGKVNKKWVIIGGVGIGAIVVVAYARKRKAGASTTGAAGSTVTDPAGNVCAALGASGYCPGSPEDAQYLQQQSAGTGAFGPGYGGGGGGYGGGNLVTDQNGNMCAALDPLTGLCPVSGSGGTPVPAITTNAEWVQRAEAMLGNTPTVQAALGYALSGQPVTVAQRNLFMEAVGLVGMGPPQGYPPLNVTGGNQPPPDQSQVTVPLLEGERVQNAMSALQALGLRGTFGVRRPGVAYIVRGSTPRRGTKVKKGSTVHLSIMPEPKKT